MGRKAALRAGTEDEQGGRSSPIWSPGLGTQTSPLSHTPHNCPPLFTPVVEHHHLAVTCHLYVKLEQVHLQVSQSGGDSKATMSAVRATGPLGTVSLIYASGCISFFLSFLSSF